MAKTIDQIARQTMTKKRLLDIATLVAIFPNGTFTTLQSPTNKEYILIVQ